MRYLFIASTVALALNVSVKDCHHQPGAGGSAGTSSSTSTSSSSAWTPADGAPSCDTLPACSGLVYQDATYGALCPSPSGPSFTPTQWRGAPVCCAELAGGLAVIASCVERPLAGRPCDPAFPAESCNQTLACGTDPSCSGPCCASGGGIVLGPDAGAGG